MSDKKGLDNSSQIFVKHTQNQQHTAIDYDTIYGHWFIYSIVTKHKYIKVINDIEY